MFSSDHLLRLRDSLKVALGLVGRNRARQAGHPETRAKKYIDKRKKPETVKGIYVSAYIAGNPNRLTEYVSLTEETEINAMVIDVKDVTGEVTYESEVFLAQRIGAVTRRISDLKAMVRGLKDKGIYLIARVATFADDILPRERPGLAVVDSKTGGLWLDHRGLAWSNPYKPRVWEYNVAIAKEAAELGFDEIQFDYVRFSSDGPIDRAKYRRATGTRADAISGFLAYARNELSSLGVYLAADVFGRIGRRDVDKTIGQGVGKMAPYLDVLCPMLYPSHYGSGAYGSPNPNAEPYKVVRRALADFRSKIEPGSELELRPWLQDFNRGVPEYGPAEVRAQIQATYDSAQTGWMLWNPLNEYTKDALEAES